MADDVKQPADTAKNDAPVTPPDTKFTSAKEDPVQGVRNADEVTPAVDLKATAPSAEGSTATATAEEKKADPVTPPAANATAPVEEKKADAPLNTAPPAEEKAEKKDGDAPAAPVAETEEEIRKKKEAEANANKPAQPQQQTAPTADTPIDNEQLQQSRFATNLAVHPDSLAKMREVWPDPDFQLDAELARALGPEGKVYPHKGGLVFELQNNHAIEWHANLGGAEFIGMPNRSKNFDEVDAHGVMAAARQRGWKAVNVYGNDAQKEMMWLEAKKQGLGVANFAPPEGSAVYEKLAQFEAQKSSATADQLVVGASAAEQGPIDLSNSKFAATDKKPETEAPKQDAPKQETTADAPPAETAKTEAPKALEGLEGFLDKKIEAAKGDPELQKGITALRDGIKSGAIAVDETSAGMIRSSLGKDDTTPSEPKKYAEIEGFLRTADKANDGLKLPAVTIAAAKETPAAIVPKEAKPAKNAVAPA